MLQTNLQTIDNSRLTVLFRLALPSVLIAIALLSPLSDVWAEIIERPDNATALVQTNEGTVEGLVTQSSQVFLGIPYAAPPTGERRWQPPHDVEQWSGVRQAKEFGAACPQPTVHGLIPNHRALREDCLTLNVAAPIGAKKLPVMVIIHGGGMIAGSGEYNFALAPILNAEGIVLVTLNYRLSSLGFFAHPQLDGSQGVNFGLMDMLASLRWINRNIRAFGGDPDQVTIVGVSAGAMSVNMLMANPASAGLISGGIAQSGYGTWPLQPRTKQITPLANAPSAEAIAMELASQATGKPSDRVTRKDLYAVTAEQWTSTVRGFHLPIIDGISQIEESGVLFALGKQHPVPFISGGTSFDGSVFGISGLSREDLLAITEGQSDRMRQLWADDFAVSDEQGFSRFFGDLRYVYAAQNMTRSMQQVERPAYLYMFEYVAPEQRDQVPGAVHAADQETMWTKFNLPIAATMRNYWINFVKTGNPNGQGLPSWPAVTESKSAVWMVFGDKATQKDNIHAEKMAFIDKLWRARVAPLLVPR